MAKRQPKREHFRFVAPDQKRGKWRRHWSTAMIDAAGHYLNPAEPVTVVRVQVSVDPGVAMNLLPQLKDKGYTFERVMK